MVHENEQPKQNMFCYRDVNGRECGINLSTIDRFFVLPEHIQLIDCNGLDIFIPQQYYARLKAKLSGNELPSYTHEEVKLLMALIESEAEDMSKIHRMILAETKEAGKWNKAFEREHAGGQLYTKYLIFKHAFNLNQKMVDAFGGPPKMVKAKYPVCPEAMDLQDQAAKSLEETVKWSKDNGN